MLPPSQTDHASLSWKTASIHGTECKIGTGHLTIHLERSGKRLLIRISDDGVGMDEEVLSRMNERLGRERTGTLPPRFRKPGEESRL